MDKKLVRYEDFGIEDDEKELSFKVKINDKVEEKAREQKEEYNEGQIGYSIGKILEELGWIAPRHELESAIELYNEAVKEAANELEVERGE